MVATGGLVVLLGGLTGCADDGGGSGGGGGDAVDVPADEFEDATGKTELDVAVKDNVFDPVYVEVSPGTKVVWTNDGRNDHNIIPVDDGSFEGIDRADFGPGKVHTATFDDAGDYPYYCSIHGTKKLNGQAGVIRVTDAAG